jgi:DNA modification methylase
MNKAWDSDIAFRPEIWGECLRVLKPGGFFLAFGSPRTFHRLVCAIEDAGFEIRDMILWIHAQGFPKAHNVARAIDKKLGYAPEVIGSYTVPIITGNHFDSSRGSHVINITAPSSAEAKRWQGWQSALKPAFEPILVARKSMIGSIADNVLLHGAGGLNIDGCRVPIVGKSGSWMRTDIAHRFYNDRFLLGSKCNNNRRHGQHPKGRWAANILRDGSDEVMEAFAAFGSTDSPARFFYCAKANKRERGGSRHPCVKPLKLIKWLVKLVTPPGGTALEPFGGTETTGLAACLQGFNVVLIEQEEEYIADIKRRLAPWIRKATLRAEPEPSQQDIVQTSKI